MDIFVVTGKTGDYDGSRSWNVRAFRTQASAEALTVRLNAWCIENHVDMSDESEASRRVGHETESKRLEVFEEDWYEKHGGRPDWRTDPTSQEEVKTRSDLFCDCVEAYNLFCANDLKLGLPPEDPDFYLMDGGVTYSVKSLQLDD